MVGDRQMPVSRERMTENDGQAGPKFYRLGIYRVAGDVRLRFERVLGAWKLKSTSGKFGTSIGSSVGWLATGERGIRAGPPQVGNAVSGAVIAAAPPFQPFLVCWLVGWLVSW